MVYLVTHFPNDILFEDIHLFVLDRIIYLKTSQTNITVNGYIYDQDAAKKNIDLVTCGVAVVYYQLFLC